MAKKRPHCAMNVNTTEMPIPAKQLYDFPGSPKRQKGYGMAKSNTPVTPPGKVSTQKGSHGGSRPHGFTPYERGNNPDLRSRHERTPPGSYPTGARNMRYTAMPRVGHQSATAPGALAYPGSERNSATMDARSSVPVSIQHGPNCRDRFGSLGMYEKGQREDNAQLDDGVGSGRRARGTFRGQRRY